MKTSNISKISASIPNTKKAKFNLSHDNNTTYDWGSVQPLMSKMMLPDSSINVNMEQLTRLAPMVVPTFGRVKLKNIAHFVPMQEIFPNWDAMMSQTKVTRPNLGSNGQITSVSYVPKYVPYINNNILAAYILAGAKVNLYFSGAVGTINENVWTCARNTGTWNTPAGYASATTATREYLNKILDIDNTNSPTTIALTPWNYNGYTMYLRKIILSKTGAILINTNGYATLGVPTISTMMETPLPNANGTGYTHSASNEQNQYDSTIGDSHISFQGADVIWEYAGSAGNGITSTDRALGSGTPVENISTNEFDGCKIRLVFKLSSFGKRLRKILIGLGYDVNLANDDYVSILPLIAFYKAWWDSYAPERYKNFYETNAWKVINSCISTALGSNILNNLNDTNATGFRSAWRGFMSDLGTCFATEKMDAISAATDSYYGNTNSTGTTNTDLQNSIASAITTVLRYPIDTSTTPNTNADGSTTTSAQTSDNIFTHSQLFGTALQAYASYQTKFTQPEIDSLKKAYIMLNKSSVAGMKVEEILRALGLGDYVEECKGKFINANDNAIKISDVVATAATDDAKLGQYGGRGLGVGNFQFSFKTNRHGYMIILSSIIPESGYINAPVHENEAISFETMYNPEFDGLAYEAIQKKNLAGSPLINDSSYADTFGFLPTYSQWKFMTNKANGDFSLNSMKNSLTPYTLDKYIPVSDTNVYKVEETVGHAGSTTEICAPNFKYSDLPNAGEDYRYVNKFPWNGNYNRIFADIGDGYEWSVFSQNNNQFLYNSFEYDNFLVHNVFNVAYFAHMKSIEDSYGTYDEEHGAPNSTVTRS